MIRKETGIDRSPVTFEEIDRIGDTAFAKAREENRRMGIPNGFVRDGKKLWELPDGTVTDVNPFVQQASEDASSDAEGSA